MKDGLLENIRSAGHWRINIRPSRPLAEKLSIAQCRTLVHGSSVELRGWDFPHIHRGRDEFGGSENGDGFYAEWTDWYVYHEFWRMYQSGQFLSYKAMWEDREEFDGAPAKPFLSIEGAIYLFTEIVEFASRLSQAASFQGGVSISITGNVLRDRRLWVGQNRMPFFDPKVTKAETIEVSDVLQNDLAATPAVDVSLKLIKEFVDRFGWTPTDDQIRRDQERLLRREL